MQMGWSYKNEHSVHHGLQIGWSYKREKHIVSKLPCLQECVVDKLDYGTVDCVSLDQLRLLLPEENSLPYQVLYFT